MINFKSTILVGVLLSFNVFASDNAVVYDKNIHDLLYAVNDCQEQLNEVLRSSNVIKEVKVEHITSQQNEPNYEIYSISTRNGDFAGAVLNILRKFEPSISGDDPTKGKWVSECVIAY